MDIQDRREVIREIQSFLLDISYRIPSFPHITIDGIYGKETEDAVRYFQELYELPVTGIVDFLTLLLLFAVYSDTEENANGE